MKSWKTITPAIVLLLFLVYATPVTTAASDVVANGSFTSNSSGWSFVVASGSAKGAWNSAGYVNGGSVKIYGSGSDKAGAGYWEQTLSTSIQAGSTVSLSYAWKKDYAKQYPAQQDLYVTIVKPDGSTADLDSQLGPPAAYKTWYVVADKDVSAFFNQSGTYKLRLRFVFKTATVARAKAIAFFDEVKLLVSSPSVGGWVEEASTPDVGGYGEAVVGTGSYIYVARCLYASSTPQFWKYDPGTNSWSSLSVSGLPTGAFRSGTALAWDTSNYIYALGGARYEDTDRRLFFRYSISANSWTQLTNTLGPQGAGDALAWSGYDGYVYALLGSNQHGTIFARYSPTSGWELRKSPPAGIDDGASLAWTGGQYLYALRGEYSETSPLKDFWRYDIVSDTWTTIASIPQDSGVGDGASLLWVGNWLPEQSNYVYALGGGDVKENPGDNFYRYSISGDSWEKLQSVPYPVGFYVGGRLGFAAGRIYYWQGARANYLGGGNRFCVYEW